MRSPRGNRFRPLLLLALFILTIIYLTTGSRSTQTSEFYTRTVAAMESRQKTLREGLSGALSPAEDKAVKAQQAAEAKVRGGEGEIVLDKVRDHGNGKGEKVSKEKSGAGQKPIVDKDDLKEEVEKARGKAKEIADEVVGNAKKKTGSGLDGGKDYSGKGGHKEQDGTLKEGAKEYSGKGGHKEETAPKEGAMKYHGKTDDEETDAVHGPKDAEKSVAGRKKVTGKAGEDDGVAKVGNTGKHVKEQTKEGAKKVKAGSDEEESTIKKTDHEVEAELDSILKKSPIIIFSKTFCPFSKKAKHILLDTYKIVPAPYVEELDEHKMGERLQAALKKTTGRRTVPNILINGVSIGGGDDIEELDEAGKLADKILDIGGKRIMEVKKLEVKAGPKRFRA